MSVSASDNEYAFRAYRYRSSASSRAGTNAKNFLLNDFLCCNECARMDRHLSTPTTTSLALGLLDTRTTGTHDCTQETPEFLDHSSECFETVIAKKGDAAV